VSEQIRRSSIGLFRVIIKIISDKHRCISLSKLDSNTDAQAEKLSQFFGCARWCWNRALNETTTTYAETGKGLSREGLNALLPALKKEFVWLGECHSQVLQSVTLNLSKALKG
jgi:transposase